MTFVNNTGSGDRYCRIRRNRLNVDEGNRALCGVFSSIARCEIQILIHLGIGYVLNGITDRYVGIDELQLSSKSRIAIKRSLNTCFSKQKEEEKKR